jgi:serine/threonine protein kinase
MCSLRHAFDAQSLNALAVKVLKGNYPPLSSNYSKGLRDLVAKMLSVNPKDRPTVVQVLKTPVLKKRLVNYIQ